MTELDRMREAKRAEIDIWDGMLMAKVMAYMRDGMSHEAAEERASKEIREEIRRS